MNIKKQHLYELYVDTTSKKHYVLAENAVEAVKKFTATQTCYLDENSESHNGGLLHYVVCDKFDQRNKYYVYVKELSIII